MSHEWCELGAAFLDPESKTLFAQCKGSPVGDGEAPDYGRTPMMCALGLIALPAPANQNGAAEGLVARDVAGADGVIVAARDTRMSKVVGKAKPGDTILTSTGKAIACVHLKDDEKQVAVLSEDSQGRTMMLLIDGKNNKLQIAMLGAMIQIDENGNIALASADGTALLIGNGQVNVVGKLTGGTPKPGLSIALCTPVGYAPGGIVASQVGFIG